MIAAIVSTTGLYLSLVQPVFFPNDLTNPAVQHFVASEQYRRSADPFFAKLIRYNENKGDTTEPVPDDFLMTDVSQFGLVVSMFYKTVSKHETFEHGYRYEPQIIVRLAVPELIIFVMLETFLVLCIAASVLPRVPPAQRAFEDRALTEYFGDEITGVQQRYRSTSAIVLIEETLFNFHAYVMQLARRYDDRPGIQIRDEHDVQDVLYAALKIHLQDVQREEAVPSTVGASSRIDFLLRDEEIGIEVKMVRDGQRDGKLGDELLLDLARYSAHPACRYLFLFIYDPAHQVQNPMGLRADLVEKGQSLGMPVNVVYGPPR
ncbi:hypothetical protein [Burkholderia cepacia]|uniref:PD-(D/E)XK nuclease domain-containing protein n=1 Tax=Burkholderia cepacia TaxID=292 RepID=UPI00158DE68A|nr:hypothetical protein [Burkholderia cepacia]